MTLAELPCPLPYGLHATITGTGSAVTGRNTSRWIVTPSRSCTATSLSSTTSTGRARNGGATRNPASSVRVPGSKAVSTPVRAGGSGWDGTNTIWSLTTSSSRAVRPTLGLLGQELNMR